MAESHQVVEGDAELIGEAFEVALHHLPGEAVDPGGDGRVGGEDRACPGRLHRFAETQALLGDQAPDPLEAEEAGMALVGVEDLRMLAGGVQGPDAADPEEHLLADPVLGVAGVEPVGHAPGDVVVLVDVGVEEVEGDPAHLGPPQLGHQRSA